MLGASEGTDAAAGAFLLAGLAFAIGGLFPDVTDLSVLKQIPHFHGFRKRASATVFAVILFGAGVYLTGLSQTPSPSPAAPPTTSSTTSQSQFAKNTLYKLPGASADQLPFQAIDQTQISTFHNPDALWIDYETGQPVYNSNQPLSPDLGSAVIAFGSPGALIKWVDQHLEKA